MKQYISLFKQCQLQSANDNVSRIRRKYKDVFLFLLLSGLGRDFHMKKYFL